MRKINKILSLIFVASTLVGCSESYLDINTDPNNPGAEDVTPNLSLAGALIRPTEGQSAYQVRATQLGAVFMQQWAGDINNIANPFSDEYRLNLSTNFYADIWDNLYRGLATNEAIITSGDPVYNNHIAIARINKAFYFQTLVDLYGDIPYSEALQLGENINPSYDNAQTIYRDLIVQLNLAIAQINDSSNALPVGAEDIVFQGDLNRWKQFANTIKLRILMRQSQLADVDAGTAAYLTAEFAALDNDFLTSDATLNPGYINNSGQQNPYYATLGFDAQGNPAFRRNVNVATDYSAEFLKGNQTQSGPTQVTTGVFDGRVNVLYAPLSGTVVGIVQGEVDVNAPDNLSKLGTALISSSSQDLFLMTAAESYFLQSEAVFEGYLTGDAKSLFQEGIRSSYDTLGLTVAEANNYIANSDAVNRIGWDGSSNKLEAIMTQKWIGLNGISSIQSFIDYNRTGFPVTPLSLIAQKTDLPKRLLYPNSEFVANSANVPAQTINSAFTNGIFWDVN